MAPRTQTKAPPKLSQEEIEAIAEALAQKQPALQEESTLDKVDEVVDDILMRAAKSNYSILYLLLYTLAVWFASIYYHDVLIWWDRLAG